MFDAIIASDKQRIEIAEDAPLQAGDVVEMDFNLLGDKSDTWWRATQYAVIEAMILRKHPLFEIKSIEETDYGVAITFNILAAQDTTGKVQEAGVPVTALVIASLIVVGGIFAYFALGKVYKIVDRVVDTPAGQIMIAGTGIAAGTIGIGILIIAILMLLRKVKS